MFLSQRPNNDPQPYKPIGMFVRHAERRPGDVYDPRPEFTQTHDPEPHRWSEPNPFTGKQKRTSDTDLVIKTRGHWEWAPRHAEFDTPVNPILAEFRRNGGNSVLYIGLDRWPTPEEIKFAQRVLKLRATLSN